MFVRMPFCTLVITREEPKIVMKFNVRSINNICQYIPICTELAKYPLEQNLSGTKYVQIDEAQMLCPMRFFRMSDAFRGN
jgi:hypothetical protein